MKISLCSTPHARIYGAMVSAALLYTIICRIVRVCMPCPTLPCMSICVHVCVCVFVSTYVRACVRVCACVSACVHVHVWVHACMRACVLECVRAVQWISTNNGRGALSAVLQHYIPVQ